MTDEEKQMLANLLLLLQKAKFEVSMNEMATIINLHQKAALHLQEQDNQTSPDTRPNMKMLDPNNKDKQNVS